MEVKCSSGTYIRSLAADLGRVLGPGGHLKSLRRLASGSFEAQDALSSKEFSRKDCRFLLRDMMIPLWAALPNMPEIKVDEVFANKVRHGCQPAWEELNESLDLTGLKDGHAKVVRDSELVAIIKVTRSEEVGDGKVKIDRVFS
jgi:tRNA pseudouridine55 synthase